MLEAARCGIGPSGRNGGFLHGYWSSLARFRDVLGAEGALAVARAADGAIPAVRALGDDVWLREGGLLRVSTSPAQDRSSTAPWPSPASSASRRRRFRCLARSWRGTARRRPSGAASSSATGRPSIPRGSCGPCADEALAAGVRLHERTKVARIDNGLLDTKRGIVRATGGRRRHQRLGGGLEAVIATADAVRQLRRPHRAGARPARRDRLDRRRGDHRLPHVPALLPDDRRRPRADGLGLGPDRLPRQDRQALLRDRGTAARAEAGLRLLLPGLAAAKVEHAWGARSTSPPTTCRSSARCPAPDALRRRLHGQRRRAQLARRPDPRLARARPGRRVVAPAARRSPHQEPAA